MSSRDETPRETYPVQCYYCQAPFDAVEASWCSCLGGTRTLVCPFCLSCFCKAPLPYKSTFWKRAPAGLYKLHLAHGTPNHESHEHPLGTFKRPLVLVADDSADTAEMAAEMVSALGYGVVIAHNGQQCLDMARAYRPELVLADALMPKIDGREMCRRLKQDPDAVGVKVVIMTALYTKQRDRLEAIRQFKVDDYLVKPVGLDQLREVINRLLG